MSGKVEDKREEGISKGKPKRKADEDDENSKPSGSAKKAKQTKLKFAK